MAWLGKSTVSMVQGHLGMTSSEAKPLRELRGMLPSGVTKRRICPGERRPLYMVSTYHLACIALQGAFPDLHLHPVPQTGHASGTASEAR